MGEREIIGKDPADIRRDIEDTRASISEKLEALESQVKETATDTLQSVKETALDKYEEVKDKLSLQHQVQQRPWAMFGGAIGVGFVIGSLLGNKLGDHEPDLSAQTWTPQLAKANGHTNGHQTNGNGHPKTSGISPAGLLTHSALVSGLTGILGQTFAPELRKARGAAIGAVLGIVREIAREAVPASVADKTVKVIDEVTRSLGGDPVVRSESRVKPPSPQFATP